MIATDPHPSSGWDDNQIDELDPPDWLELLADEVEDETRSHAERRQKRSRPHADLQPTHVAQLVGESEDIATTGLNISYTPSRHEAAWLIDALGPFITESLIIDVVRLVKGGKEASVYQCAAHPSLGVDYVAAKVYRPRSLRNLRNDAVYRHGRVALDADGKLVKDSRALHAIRTGTGVGQSMRHTSWLSHEYTTLQRLHDAGADVPRPYAIGANAVLMGYLGDRRQPAPTLNHIRLRGREAEATFRRTVDNIEQMLSLDMVHGDLSAYNILYWRGSMMVIDFPQVVNPYQNPAAKAIFGRDVERVCQYFTSCGLEVDASELADDLWQRYVKGETWSELPVMDLIGEPDY